MAIATDKQVQTYADTRIRPHSESVRNILAALQDDESAIGDVYAEATQGSPTWTDSRIDGPPHLLINSDIPNYNAFLVAFNLLLTGSGEDQATKSGYVDTLRSNYPTLLKACVRPISTS